MGSEKDKSLHIKQLTEDFWALSRKRQEAFLKALHDLSPQNKDFFKIWLGGANKKVVEGLKKEIQKETGNRIGRFKKLRLSKLNEILRNADKYALSILEIIELKKEVWMGMLAFLLQQSYVADRYQVACARHIDQYITMVDHHVLEVSEKKEILAETKNILMGVITKGAYLPSVEDVYLKHFHKGE